MSSPRFRLVDRLLSGNRVSLLLWSFVLLFALSGTWAISNPIATVPDEPAHVIKAVAVVHGDPFGTISTDATNHADREFKVAEVYAELHDLRCNAFIGTEPVSTCELNIDEPAGSVFDASSGAWGYNPVYYAVVGWPSLIANDLASVTAMRLVSALFSSVFLALAIWTLSFLPNRRLPVLVGMAVVTPSTLFYMGGVNPQGAEIATLAAFTAAYLVALETQARGRLLWLLSSIMLVAGTLGVQMRNLAWIWLGVIVLIGFIFAGWRRWLRFIGKPPVVIAVIAVLAGIAGNLWLMLSLDSLTGASPMWGAGVFSFPNGFLFMLWRFPEFFGSMFALFGWMDVESRWAVSMFLVISAVLVAAALLSRVRSHHRWGTIAALAALWIMPALVQASSVMEHGFIWQGRYGSPLWVVLMFVAAIAFARNFDRITEPLAARLGITIAVTLGCAHIVSLVANLHRQYIGYGNPLSRLLSFADDGRIYSQAPVIGTPGWLLVAIVLGAVTAYFAWRIVRRPALENSPEESKPFVG